MIRFSNKSVVVEVKHPRRVNKAGSSIWGDIDLDKHSKNVSHVLSGAPNEQENILRVKPAPEVQARQHVARILEDRQQVAQLEAEMKAKIETSLVAASQEEVSASVSAQMPKIEAVGEQVDEAVEAIAPVAVSEPEALPDPIPEPEIEPVSVQAADQQEIAFDAPVEAVSVIEDEEDEAEEVEQSLSSDDITAAAMADDQDVDSVDDDDAVDDVLDERPRQVHPAVESARRARFKKIPGVRYIRRNGELQVARSDKWKTRVLKTARL
ncbi:hypothetical protein [Mesorhizobium sp. SP-1A]|uniref:hypothetical protein n=1 Tax=Mesorhizobium sp. SP-1A TaxID=3077840 RepID=UPI0028F6D403|nr:hypothetical protein [Mesorhizobium sp. SP-1A]